MCASSIAEDHVDIRARLLWDKWEPLLKQANIPVRLTDIPPTKPSGTVSALFKEDSNGQRTILTETILISKNVSAESRAWTLFHELSHFVLGHNRVSNSEISEMRKEFECEWITQLLYRRFFPGVKSKYSLDVSYYSKSIYDDEFIRNIVFHQERVEEAYKKILCILQGD